MKRLSLSISLTVTLLLFIAAFAGLSPFKFGFVGDAQAIIGMPWTPLSFAGVARRSMELATAFPGNTGIRPQNVAPLAEMLRLNGYSTAAFGKYHETPAWEVSVSGPFDRWPTQSGFDKFYGFIGGETNQWAPAIFDGTARVEPPHAELVDE